MGVCNAVAVIVLHTIAAVSLTGCGRIGFSPEINRDAVSQDAIASDATIDAASVVDIGVGIDLPCESSVIISRRLPTAKIGGVAVAPTDNGFVIAVKAADAPTVELILYQLANNELVATIYRQLNWDESRARLAVAWSPFGTVVGLGKTVRWFANNLADGGEFIAETNVEAAQRSGDKVVLTGLSDNARTVVSSEFDFETTTTINLSTDTAASPLRRVHQVSRNTTFWETSNDCVFTRNNTQRLVAGNGCIFASMIERASGNLFSVQTLDGQPFLGWVRFDILSMFSAGRFAMTVGQGPTDAILVAEDETNWISYIDRQNAVQTLVISTIGDSGIASNMTQLIDPAPIGLRGMVKHPQNGVVTVGIHSPSGALLATRTCQQ